MTLVTLIRFALPRADDRPNDHLNGPGSTGNEEKAAV